jgi:hypothetical protein
MIPPRIWEVQGIPGRQVIPAELVEVIPEPRLILAVLVEQGKLKQHLMGRTLLTAQDMARTQLQVLGTLPVLPALTTLTLPVKVSPPSKFACLRQVLTLALTKLTQESTVIWIDPGPLVGMSLSDEDLS